MRRSRSIALPSLVALVAVSALTAAVPAGASPQAVGAAPRALVPLTATRASVPTTGTESVELRLTPRSRALLYAAMPKTATRAQRLASLQKALPGLARANEVAQRLTSLGMTVTGTGDFAVTATGPAALVTSLFGSARAELPQLATRQALPRIPSALSGLVTAAVGGDDNRPALLSHAIVKPAAQGSVAGRSTAANPTDGSLSVTQARALYGVPATTAAPTSSSPVIASLQFPGASAQSTTGISNLKSDLTNFASTNGIYPSSYSAASGVTTISVAETGSDCSGLPDDPETADEVALDQETLLTEAPQLKQRIYYAPNCANAQDDAIDQVVSDATASGGPNIIALTTSWGECEPQTYDGGNGLLEADEDAVAELTMAGITMFAASGDDGAYDCLDGNGNPIATDAVDAPGSVPGVIAAGGTQGVTPGTLAAWNSSEGSTGGGFSCGITDEGYALPSYQSSVAKTPSYPHNGPAQQPSGDSTNYKCAGSSSRRQVPDMAADAGEGLDVIVTEPGASRTTYQVIGTSLAAPLLAGGFAQTLTAIAPGTSGIGDITSLVYGGTGFVDVTRGNNGDYAAGTGYDLTTGVGTPVWPLVLAKEATSTATDALPLLSGYNPTQIAFNATVAVSGYADPSSTVNVEFHVYGQNGYDVRRTLTSGANGLFSFTYTATKDERYVAAGNGKLSNYELTSVPPSVNGPTTVDAPKNSTVTITGQSTSGADVYIHFHAQGTPAGDYSIVREVGVSGANGPYSRAVALTRDYRFYVTGTNGLSSPIYLLHGT